MISGAYDDAGAEVTAEVAADVCFAELLTAVTDERVSGAFAGAVSGSFVLSDSGAVPADDAFSAEEASAVFPAAVLCSAVTAVVAALITEELSRGRSGGFITSVNTPIPMSEAVPTANAAELSMILFLMRFSRSNASSRARTLSNISSLLFIVISTPFQFSPQSLFSVVEQVFDLPL